VHGDKPQGISGTLNLRDSQSGIGNELGSDGDACAATESPAAWVRFDGEIGMSTATEGYKIIQAEINNVLRIPLMLLDAQGRHICISGDNGLGKSSAIAALIGCINGMSSRDYPKPIHDGAKKGYTKETLSNGSDVLTINRTFTVSCPTGRVAVTGKAGDEIKDAHELLKRFKYSEYASHPLEFLEKRPQDQLDEFLAIYGVAPPVAGVRQLTGEDHQPLPGESAYAYLMRLGGDKGTYYDRRREAHRVAQDKEAAVQEQRRELDRLGGKPEDEPQSAGDLVAQISALQEVAEQRRAALTEAADAEKQRADNASAVDRLEKQRASEAGRVVTLEKQLAEIKRQIDEANAGIASLDDRIAKGRQIIADDTKDAAALKAAASRLTDPAPELAKLKSRLDQIETANADLAKRQQAAEHLERLVVDYESAVAIHKRLDDIMAALREQRQHLLDGVDIGIDGVTVGEGELLLKGIPFRSGQTSRSDAIIVAFHLVRKQKPLAAILWLDNAESLGEKNRLLMYRLANEHGLQVVETRRTDDQELRIEFFDAEPPQASKKKSQLFEEQAAGQYVR